MFAEDRPVAVLRALVAFAKDKGRWPGADELRLYRRRIGSRATVQRTLAVLRDRGMVELRGRRQSSRWVPEPPAFDLLRIPPFVAPLERQRARDDAATLLSPRHASPIHTAHRRITPSAAAYATSLEVHG